MSKWNERVMEIAKITVGKRENPAWRQFHKHRLNAEYFGILERLYQTHREPTYDNKDFWKVRHDINEWNIPEPTLEQEWEKEHKQEALREYEEKAHQKAQETGIWIFPNGFAAASPEGIVRDEGNPDKNRRCVLIKCPLEVGNIRPIKPALELREVTYLDGQNNLITTHAFYHEVQGCLAATNAEWCDFVVWSPEFLSIQRILPDQNWHTEIFSNISYIYKLYLLRREDRRYWHYRRDPTQMEELDLAVLFNMPAPAKKKILKTFVYCIACHIGRWIWIMTRDLHNMPYWEQRCPQYWDEAASRMCERCLVNNFLFLWKEQNPKEEKLPDEIQQICDKKWKIPNHIMDLAATRVKKLGINNGIFCEPCMCLKW